MEINTQTSHGFILCPLLCRLPINILVAFKSSGYPDLRASVSLTNTRYGDVSLSLSLVFELDKKDQYDQAHYYENSILLFFYKVSILK